MLLHGCLQFPQHRELKSKDGLSLHTGLIWACVCGLVSRLPVLLPWSPTVFAPVPHRFDYCASYCVLRSATVRPPTPFFFLKIAWSPSVLHINFIILFFYCCKNCHWVFDRDRIESVDCFVQYGCFLTILIHDVIYLFVSSFISSTFRAFQHRSLLPSWLSLCPSILFFLMLLQNGLFSQFLFTCVLVYRNMTDFCMGDLVLQLCRIHLFVLIVWFFNTQNLQGFLRIRSCHLLKEILIFWFRCFWFFPTFLG